LEIVSVVLDSVELGDFELPSVFVIEVGDWEGNQGFSKIILDFSEENFVNLAVSGEEEGE